MPSSWRVHPRVGGETAAGEAPDVLLDGPSPRGRGNHRSRRRILPGPEVHPRVGGETRRGNVDRRGCAPQVHPRVGGGATHVVRTCNRACTRGPSPRGRGKPSHRPDLTPLDVTSGSIPAWAGKPVQSGSGCRHGRSAGPSPRGRGNLTMDRLTASPCVYGSIPAWAGKPDSRSCNDPVPLNRVHPPRGRGNPPYGRAGRQIEQVHPRVGGETRRRLRLPVCRRGSIPAWAGKPSPGCRACSPVDGSIPAWAGKPARTEVRVPPSVPAVHPRVGGETN